MNWIVDIKFRDTTFFTTVDMARRDSCIIKFVLGVDPGESEVVTFTICHFSSCEKGCVHGIICKGAADLSFLEPYHLDA